MSTPLDDARYVSLETFRKDGSGVKTPIWIAPLDGKLVVSTPGTTFKVKRVRANPRVRVAACNSSGSQILGPWYEGTARVLTFEESTAGDAALDAKYGWQRTTLTFFARLFGKIKNRVTIEITLQP